MFTIVISLITIDTSNIFLREKVEKHYMKFIQAEDILYILNGSP